MQSLSDSELVEQVKNGNDRAFGELVSRYEKKVFFVVKRMINDDDEAADATQEVFIKLHASLKKFRGDSNLYTYVYRIATNVAISYLRKRKVRAVVRLDELVSNMLTGGNEPQREADRAELKKLVSEAVAALPVQQRQVFILRFYEELSYEEIAQMMHRSLGAMKANYFHAMKKIGEYLKNAM
ncbi:MAG: sigma-70 family RNA polymerase sigma factor [Bacteroidetes bacterium]|nr:sigma-70 family RNA polymerase sigma factor [Bacteroidota bacterium]MCL5739017.1 sigma-70 family RNA polymerase sigma factor [Bacteroidota bacterium]